MILSQEIFFIIAHLSAICNGLVFAMESLEFLNFSGKIFLDLARSGIYDRIKMYMYILENTEG